MVSNPETIEWEVKRAGEKAMRVTSPAPREIWRRLIDEDSEVLVFQNPSWIEAMVATGAYEDASRLFEFPDGRRMILPLVRRSGLPTWMAVEASFPESWGMGGLVGPGPQTPAEVAAVFADFRQRGVVRASIRPNPLFATSWSTGRPAGVLTLPRRAHVLNLEGGFSQIWSKRFNGSMRSAVRKAERSGLEVECDTSGKLIPEFYQLFLRSVDRWAAQQHEPPQMAQFRARMRDPIRKFQAIARAVTPAFRLWIARKNGMPAAAILVLQGKNASYTRGAMDMEIAGPLRANEFLHRMAIEEACQAGCLRYHLGETGASSQLAQFKEKLGGEPVEYAAYCYERLPITKIDRGLRDFVKRIIGFKDAK